MNMNLDAFLLQLRSALKELKEIDLGYPAGDNTISAPEEPRNTLDQLTAVGAAQSSLVNFYHECNGFSLPDVHNGYFVKPLKRLVDDIREREPTRVSGIFDDEIIPFGSTGGGSRLVLRKSDGSVWLLQNGFQQDRTLMVELKSAKRVASTFDEFLEVLINDVQAFLSEDDLHSYLS